MTMRYAGGYITAANTNTIYNTQQIGGLTVTPSVEYLVVGGGGSSSCYAGAGAGGVLYGPAYTVTQGTTYNVVVGAGGTISVINNCGYISANGNNSSFGTGVATYSLNATSGTVTAYGGGRAGGGYLGSGNGYAGGSGGGGSRCAGGATLNSCQGHAGAPGNGAGSYDSGSGGGFAYGPCGNYNISPCGGGGLTTNILGYPYGVGGGGGGGAYEALGVAGGSGGGGSANCCAFYTGAGGQQNRPKPVPGFNGTSAGNSNGTPYTGGGAGGYHIWGNLYYLSGHTNTVSAGYGGSGIVIIRYPSYYALPAATTGSPTLTYNSGFRIYTWINSGSITF